MTTKKPTFPVERDFSDGEIDNLVREVALRVSCGNCSNNSSGPLGEEGRRDRHYSCSVRKKKIQDYDGEKTVQECSDYRNRFLKGKEGGRK